MAVEMDGGVVGVAADRLGYLGGRCTHGRSSDKIIDITYGHGGKTSKRTVLYIARLDPYGRHSEGQRKVTKRDAALWNAQEGLFIFIPPPLFRFFDLQALNKELVILAHPKTYPPFRWSCKGIIEAAIAQNS
jgi:hypothetical protein